jgi:hypothetical protein
VSVNLPFTNGENNSRAEVKTTLMSKQNCDKTYYRKLKKIKGGDPIINNKRA